MSFFVELKRRNVFKVGIAYVVASWLILQMTDVLSELMELNTDIGKVIIILLIVGFIPALIFAWAFEMTPDGVKREKDVDRSQSITPNTGKKLNNTIVVMMALAIGYLLFDKFSSPVQMGSESNPQISNKPSAQTVDEDLTLTPIEAIPKRQSIAVLPFDNRSRNIDDEYFTEGIHDDLLTNLARIGSLKVISRTSVNRYKETEKSIPEIAAELGVATVMEGAVQRSGSTVRINVQLIDAKTDEHLWAEIFDRELTAENLFAIQSEISEKIARALEATLSPEEEQRINEFPTQNLEAYNAYLRGRQLLPQRNSKDLALAMESFERAVELDPEFALAWVGIAESANLLHAHGTLNTGSQQKIMAAAISRALEINPQLGEAYTSKGSLLDEINQNDQAEVAYQRAIELSPNYATAYQWYSILIYKTHNRLQEGLDLLNKAQQLDPLSPIIQSNKARLYTRMGRFAEAESEYKQLLAANPEFSQGMGSMSWFLYTRALGQLDDAVVLIQKSKRVDPGKMSTLVQEYFQWLALNDNTRAQTVYQQMEDLDADHFWLPVSEAFMDIRHGRYTAAKEQALFLAQSFDDPASQWWAGLIFAGSSNYDLARDYMLKVEPRYLDRAQWSNILNEGTEDACTVGLSLARTGDEKLGHDLLRFAANYWQQTAPAYIRHADRYPIFQCYAYLGELEKSLAALEISLSHQHVLSTWVFIASDPEYRLLHADPRFQAMDQKARAELSRQRERLAQLELGTAP